MVMDKSLPGSDEVGPIMQHHGADDLLPATVDVTDGTEGTYCSVDQRRPEQVLQRTILVVHRIYGVRERHWAPRTEAVEERGGGVWSGGMMPG